IILSKMISRYNQLPQLRRGSGSRNTCVDAVLCRARILLPMFSEGRWRVMLWQLRASVLGLLLLSGCGGMPRPAIGFINHTQHSDAQLWALWKAAQQNLSQQIDLNPLQQQQTNVPPEIIPGDPRVWNISPRQISVSAQRDISSAMLLAATGTTRSDPTGLIACPQPCNVHYAAAYSLYTQ